MFMTRAGETRPVVRLAALLTAIAFAGVFVVVLVLVVGGRGTPDPAAEQLAQARREVSARPGSPEAWAALTAALVSDRDLGGALAAARRAHRLAPAVHEHTLTLATLLAQQGRTGEAVAVAERYTQRRPDDGDGHLLLAQLADRHGGRPHLARLAFGAFLRLRPDDPLAAEVRTRLSETGPVRRPAGPAVPAAA